MTGEPGGPPCCRALLGTGREVLLPVLRADRDLDWARADPAGPTVPGARLTEPAGDRLGPDADRRGARSCSSRRWRSTGRGVRLGRGGGSYDRALARVRAGHAGGRAALRRRDGRRTCPRSPMTGRSGP